jgi:hypothetical protein
MVLTPPRSDALANARYTYAKLADRAYQAQDNPKGQSFVVTLATAWERQLTELQPAYVSDDEATVLDHLVATVSDPGLSRDALVEWLDAFPAAIAEMFPAGTVALQGDFDTELDIDWAALLADQDPGPAAEDQVAGNRQSTLARAA